MFPSVTDFLLFFWMPFAIKPILPEKTKVRVCLVVTSTVEAFEGMGARFTLLGFQSKGIRLAIIFAILCKMSAVFRFVGTVTFGIFWFLNSARKGCMTPFPAVLALRYTRIHVGTSNRSYVASYVEASVD